MITLKQLLSDFFHAYSTALNVTFALYILQFSIVNASESWAFLATKYTKRM